MKMDQIMQVLEIVACGSISKAAQKLYMQQPNLSMSLKNLEEEFGQAIFSRATNGVDLTPFGKDFLAFAQPYYRQYMLLRQMGQNNLAFPIGRFSICSHHVTLARWAFVELCSEYSKEPIHLTFENESFENIPQCVASNQYDIGILGMVKDQSTLLCKMFSSLGLEYVPLCHASFSVVVANHHPLVKQGLKSIRLDMCKDYPFVLYTPMETYLRSLTAYQHLINHATTITVPDYMTVHEILKRSNAFSVVPLKFMFSPYQRVFESSSVELPFEDPNANLAFGYLKQKNSTLSDIGKRYIEFLISLC